MAIKLDQMSMKEKQRFVCVLEAKHVLVSKRLEFSQGKLLAWCIFFFFVTRIFWRMTRKSKWNGLERGAKKVQKWWQKEKISVMECLWKGDGRVVVWKFCIFLQMKFLSPVNEILLWLFNARNFILCLALN